MTHDILPVTSAMTRVFKMAAAMVSTDAKVSSVSLFHKRFNSTRIEVSYSKACCFVLLHVSVSYDMICCFRAVDADWKAAG